MLAIRGGEAAVASQLAAAPALSIAAHNSRTSVVLSGAAGAIVAAQKALAAQGLRSTLLGVRHGFHSADVEPALEEVQLCHGVRGVL